MRNSVKAVVDAYDGTVDLYVVDPDDPIVRAYRRRLPGPVHRLDEMPAEMRDHLRYPEDLFRVQTNMWGRYHIDGAQNFYEQADGWAVAQDPGTTTTATRRPRPPTPTRARSRRSGSGASTRSTCSCACPARNRRTS